MSQKVVEAFKVEKKFGDFKAVGGASFSIFPGECFGLLGPNGAGKSTIISMLYGAIRRSSGTLSVFNSDPHLNSREIKRRLGVVTQDNALDESLTVSENMNIYAGFLGLSNTQSAKKIDELLHFMNLNHKRDAEIRMLSGGMRRRLVFVRALLNSPELLILDEPTTGLDPGIRHLLWGKIKELKAKGTTILLTTHYMHEAELLCDRLIILNRGVVVAEGSPKSLIDQYTPGYVAAYAPEIITAEQVQQISKTRPQWLHAKDSSGYYLRAPSLNELMSIEREVNVTPTQIRPANLEDVFLHTTGKELSADD